MWKSLVLLLSFALLSGFLRDGRALGSTQPGTELFGPANPEVQGPPSQTNTRQQDTLAKLRPVERQLLVDFNQAQQLLNSKTTIQEIFDKDMERRMRERYNDSVSSLERKANDPLRRPRPYEMSQYDYSRSDLANWTAKEVMSDRVRGFLAGGDKDSAPMKVFQAVHSVTGGGDDKPSEVAASPQQKAARAHRLDLPAQEQNAAGEESIATRLKTRLNVVRGYGQVTFLNPVVTTSVHGTRDTVSVEMDRSFRKVGAGSKVRYEVRGECLQLNVNKRITDQVSLDLGHDVYTGGKRGASGEKTKESARVTYSISF